MDTIKLNVSHLFKSYGELQVLKDVNLSLDSQNVYCLMGASGSGKTTFLRILLGLEKADSGEISIYAGDNISGNDGSDENVSIRSSVAPMVCVFQEDRLCERFSPLKNVLIACGKDVREDEIYKELCQLLPEESIHRPCSTLSGGMKRRVAIARALLAPSQIILMDEPFTGLDEDTKAVVVEYIKKKTPHKLLLIATHQEEDVDVFHAKLLHL